MAYLYLALAIVFEVAGTTSMKLSEGFAKPAWAVPLILAYGISLAFLTAALRDIPVGTAYAVWSGLGTALIALVGWLVFREALSAVQMVCVGLIIAGVVGLNLSGSMH